MKKILEFTMPDDEYDFEVAQKGHQFLRSIEDLDEVLRRHGKYDAEDIINEFNTNPESVPEAIDKTVEAIRTILHRIRKDNNAYLDE